MRCLSCVDVLVDGEFMKDKKNISLQFRGSENQRLIDLRKTEEAGEIVWWDAEIEAAYQISGKDS